MKNKNGISLIVLIITIIIMIVLAGTVIYSLLNSNIIDRAKKAVIEEQKATIKQELSVALMNLKIISTKNGNNVAYYSTKEDFTSYGQLDMSNKEVLKYIVDAENNRDIQLEIKYKTKEDTYAFRLNVDKCSVEALDALETSEKKIIFNLNGGSNEENAVKEYIEGEIVTLPNPTKDDAIFGGWYLTADFSGESISTTTINTKGNLNLYAKWCEYTDTSYFTWTVSGTKATITGLSEDGQTVYNEGQLKVLCFPKVYSVDGTTYNVADINASAFSGKTNIEEVIISNTIVTIGLNAFTNCGKTIGELKVILEKGRTSLSSAFLQGANYLKHIDVPEGVTVINGYSRYAYGEDNVESYGAFRGCVNLINITIPNSVTNIQTYAFFGCTSLVQMPVSDNLTTIGVKSFKGCTSLTEIAIPSKLTVLPDNAFSGCTGISAVRIPNTITTIGTQTFINCTGITEVTLPNSSITLGANVFYNCYNLSSITIPKEVKSIGTNTFYNCGQTAKEFKVIIEEGRTTLTNGFLQGANYLKSIKIPEGVTSIQGYNNYDTDNASSGAFRDSGLTSIEFPSTVTTIGPYTFFGCTKLTSVKFPSVLTKIDHKAFKNCTVLTNIEYTDTIEKWTAITKDAWHYGVPATEIICTNGMTAI